MEIVLFLRCGGEGLKVELEIAFPLSSSQLCDLDKLINLSEAQFPLLYNGATTSRELLWGLNGLKAVKDWTQSMASGAQPWKEKRKKPHRPFSHTVHYDYRALQYESLKHWFNVIIV